MIAKLHIPAYPLDQFIESFFYYTGLTPEHSYERFLPDGNVHLLFDLTEEPKPIYHNETLQEIQICRRVWFSGFRTEPITIPSGRESEILVVNFRKGKAFPFLNEPLFALTDLVVDAELVLGRDILSLREQLQECPEIDGKLLLLEQALLRSYRSRMQRNPFVDFVVSRIEANPSQLRLNEVSRQVGYSQKHIIKMFKDEVGVTPKDFLKVIRFQKAIEEIEHSRTIQWTAVANDCGFYDQSHFIADFKAFSGLTPADYLKQRGELLNYIPIL